MKKNTTLLFFCCFIFFNCAGPQLVPEGERNFGRIVDAPGYSKEQIFNNTKIWIAENFRSAKAVLEYENKDDGVIIGNSNIPYPCSGFDCLGRGDWRIPFTMRVDIKDQKFRLTFSNLRLTWPPSYSRSFGTQPGVDRPLVTEKEYKLVKPILLKIGDRLLASFNKEKGSDKW